MRKSQKSKLLRASLRQLKKPSRVLLFNRRWYRNPHKSILKSNKKKSIDQCNLKKRRDLRRCRVRKKSKSNLIFKISKKILVKRPKSNSINQKKTLSSM